MVTDFPLIWCIQGIEHCPVSSSPSHVPVNSCKMEQIWPLLTEALTATKTFETCLKCLVWSSPSLLILMIKFNSRLTLVKKKEAKIALLILLGRRRWCDKWQVDFDQTKNYVFFIDVENFRCREIYNPLPISGPGTCSNQQCCEKLQWVWINYQSDLKAN